MDLAIAENAYQRMGEAKTALDFDAFNAADIDFQGLLRASHNIVFHQMATTIGAALAYSLPGSPSSAPANPAARSRTMER